MSREGKNSLSEDEDGKKAMKKLEYVSFASELIIHSTPRRMAGTEAIETEQGEVGSSPQLENYTKIILDEEEGTRYT